MNQSSAGGRLPRVRFRNPLAHLGPPLPRGCSFPPRVGPTSQQGGPLSFWRAAPRLAGAGLSVPPRPRLSPAASGPRPGSGATGMRGGRGAGAAPARPGPGWMGGRRAVENLADGPGAKSPEPVRPALAPRPHTCHCHPLAGRVGRAGSRNGKTRVSPGTRRAQAGRPSHPQSRPVRAGGSGPGAEGGGGRRGRRWGFRPARRPGVPAAPAARAREAARGAAARPPLRARRVLLPGGGEGGGGRGLDVGDRAARDGKCLISLGSAGPAARSLALRESARRPGRHPQTRSAATPGRDGPGLEQASYRPGLRTEPKRTPAPSRPRRGASPGLSPGRP